MITPHGPTPDPSQEGNCANTRRTMLPSLEGLGVGWLSFKLVEP